MVDIAKRIVWDLLKVAQRNTKLKKAPTRSMSGTAVNKFWQKNISIYLLFVMQKTKFIDLRTGNKENLLYQCGYDSSISLTTLLQTDENTVWRMLPYWIVIRRMTSAQLLGFIRRLKIELPKKCTKTRQSLCTFVMAVYSKWSDVLCDDNTTIPDLIAVFNIVDDWENIDEAKAFFREKIQLIVPGDEVFIMWLTSNRSGFVPIIKRTPGPHTHKMIITSWLHDLGLLHQSTKQDPRPTRVFSDTDARTHCLHLRRDSKEEYINICKQLGWTVPAALSDMGNSVYRRAEAIVTHPEYNVGFISYLQLQYEGKIEQASGIDWSSAIASARLNWLQMKRMKDEERSKEDKLRDQILQELMKSKYNDLETSVADIESSFRQLVNFLSETVIVSTQSADEVGQKILSKLKKRKKRHNQYNK